MRHQRPRRYETSHSPIVVECSLFTGEIVQFSTGADTTALMLEIVMQGLGTEISETVMVGDRLATDVLMARRAGMDAALVLTGDSRREELQGLSSVDRPTYVLERLIDLLPPD